MATAVVDTAYIAASYSIPEPTLQTLLDAPTKELVQSLLEQLVKKAKEFDTLKAEKLRSDVELEHVVHTGEARARALKAAVEKGLKEIEQLRTEVNEKGMPSAHSVIVVYSFYLQRVRVKPYSRSSIRSSHLHPTRHLNYKPFKPGLTLSKRQTAMH